MTAFCLKVIIIIIYDKKCLLITIFKRLKFENIHFILALITLLHAKKGTAHASLHIIGLAHYDKHGE